MPAMVAKSPGRRGDVVTLWQHATDVSGAAHMLFGQPSGLSPLGRAWLRFFGLSTEQGSVFLESLHVAALLHDLGKANSGFQAMIAGEGRQSWYHDLFGTLMLGNPEGRSWLHSSGRVDGAAVLGAIASHHVRSRPKHLSDPCHEKPKGVCYFGESPEVGEILSEVASILGTPAPSELLQTRFVERNALVERDLELSSYAERLRRRELDLDGDRRRLILAVKAALMAADAVGSAMFREDMDMQEWIKGCFGNPPLSGEWLEERLIAPRIRQIEEVTGRQFIKQDFQTEASELGDRALILAPCGAGKTLAAWLWVQRRLADSRYSRAIFLYPTRGTATEGFRDYVAWAGEDAALVHGTSVYDLAGLFSSPDDPRSEATAADSRLFALGWWPRRVFSATVDAFLSFMTHRYSSLCMLPVLADSVVVVDEVHSFDQSMFRALERFLKCFHIPVLTMTATLPQDRYRILTEDCGLVAFPPQGQGFGDLDRLAQAPRYSMAIVDSRDQLLSEAAQQLTEGHKVMLVFNTVQRCQEAADSLGKLICINGIVRMVLCYHSRFRLRDRRTRHQDVIRLFRESGPLALVTTQVCEMSLDLDADFLGTEIAPFPSLVQRMGRCCRKWKPGRTGAVRILPLGDNKVLPYARQELEATLSIVRQLASQGSPVSQATLAQKLTTMEVDSPFASGGYAAFCDSGLFAHARDTDFRDGDDFTLDAILDEDIEEWLQLRRKRSPDAEGLVLPVPRKFAWSDSRLQGRLRAAPATHYDPCLGFQQQEKSHG